MTTQIALATFTCRLAVSASAGPKEDFEIFRNGGKLVWDSTGHEKTKGICMKLSYPRTWRAAEGSRPNIVQKFASDSGRGTAVVVIQTYAFPKPYDRELTEIGKTEVVPREVAKEFVPEGGRLLSHKVTMIDGEICAMIESEVVTERVGFKVGQKTLSFFIPRKGVLLCVHCSTVGNASSGFDAINKHYDETRPLFLLISSSCVLTEKWKTP